MHEAGAGGVGRVGAADGDLPDAGVAVGVAAAGHLDGDEVAEVGAADLVGPRRREGDDVARLERGAHLGGGRFPVGVGGDAGARGEGDAGLDEREQRHEGGEDGGGAAAHCNSLSIMFGTSR